MILKTQRTTTFGTCKIGRCFCGQRAFHYFYISTCGSRDWVLSTDCSLTLCCGQGESFRIPNSKIIFRGRVAGKGDGEKIGGTFVTCSVLHGQCNFATVFYFGGGCDPCFRSTAWTTDGGSAVGSKSGCVAYGEKSAADFGRASHHTDVGSGRKEEEREEQETAGWWRSEVEVHFDRCVVSPVDNWNDV